MRAIMNQRLWAVLLSLLACVFLFNALRPVQGQEKEPDLKQKVKELEKTVGHLNTEVETLTEKATSLETELAKHKRAIKVLVSRVKHTEDLVGSHDMRLNTYERSAKDIGKMKALILRHETALRVHDKRLRTGGL